MSELPSLFANNLLPILLIALVGFLLGKYLGVSPEGLSKTAFYILSPALLFSLIAKSDVTGTDSLRMALLVGLLAFSLGTICILITRSLKLERKLQLAVLLAVIFMNAGNFGLSLNLFALGESALAYAGIFFAVQLVLVNSAGVLIASSGTRTPKEALLGLFKIPGLYALALALVVRVGGFSTPLAVERSVDLLAQAAIPVMLLVMGMQLSRIRWEGISRPMILAGGLRLIASPILAFAIAAAFGLQGSARQAAILEASTPTAVIAIILGTEFDLEPYFITTAVLATTLVSPLTITPILAAIGA